MHAILDVGANTGSWGLAVAQRHPNVQVFAFEPTPQLCGLIAGQAQELGLTNY